jgi:hypothetical protein
VDNEGRNVMHFACQAGQPFLVCLLLKTGADVNSTDRLLAFCDIFKLPLSKALTRCFLCFVKTLNFSLKSYFFQIKLSVEFVKTTFQTYEIPHR